MARYTDDDIRSMKKVTAKIAADYLGISPMTVTIGITPPFTRLRLHCSGRVK